MLDKKKRFALHDIIIDDQAVVTSWSHYASLCVVHTGKDRLYLILLAQHCHEVNTQCLPLIWLQADIERRDPVYFSHLINDFRFSCFLAKSSSCVSSVTFLRYSLFQTLYLTRHMNFDVGDPSCKLTDHWIMSCFWAIHLPSFLSNSCNLVSFAEERPALQVLSFELLSETKNTLTQLQKQEMEDHDVKSSSSRQIKRTE